MMCCHALNRLGPGTSAVAGVYAAMSEGELQEVADDADSLTEVARAALLAENASARNGSAT